MKQALQTFGPAPGAKQMLEWEREAAEHALATGIYVTWQGKGGNECTRVRPTALCFCGHGYQQHRLDLARNSHGCKLKSCKCQRFEYIPTRPEECGEWWLPRRKEFNVHSYQAKCKCKHSHTQHTADYQKRCKVCRCQGFTSAFLCVVCDDHSENHETVWETAAERKSRGASVGAAFLPLSSQPEMSQLVFGGYRERVNRECKHTHTYGGRPMFDAIKPRKGR